MLTAVLAWFSSTIGKTVAKWSVIVATAAAIYWRIYESGRSAEKASEAQRDAETIQKRKTIDEAVDRMPDADVRDQLARWVRHDG
ncbi:hypothetical protein E0H39_29565 [Rhizobium leguminosarum bv. viciae]|uniref:hypothetical protein n=1 Tax=Rhizobium leguminosarum TaxID=384 RepID=UPI001040A7D8|nr:hypothetical protein [Rhizobium leguminosarum]TBY57967.1 hypothetical protein E0H39_29565 [Rhizobium leguminosarum bv. viciae]